MMITKNNITIGYKDSAVGIIPEEWEVRRLGEICLTFKSGTTITSQKIRKSDLYPVYGGNGLRGYTNFYTHDGDYILIGRQGALCGNINFIKGKAYISEHAIAVQPNKYNSIEFLRHKLDFWNLNRFSESSAQPGLSVEKLVRYKLAVPPLEEQKKIAEILSTWDEAIEKQSKLIEKLELRKRGIMQRLLTGRIRLSGFNTPWKKIKLGAIGEFDKGIGIPKDQIISSGCKAITYGEIYTKYNYVIKEFTSYINEETAKESKKISSGAILFAGSGETLKDIGKCVAFIDNDIAYAGGDIIIFKPTIDIDNLVLSYILNSPSVIKQKYKYGQGHSVVHIYQKDLTKIELEVPSHPEQKAIAEVLTVADNEIATHHKKLDALHQQKHGIMQQLLTGKTRVKINNYAK